MSVDVITKFTYLEHGKEAPGHSSFKGTISTQSIVGFLNYGAREESRVLSDEAKAIIKDNKSFFNYTNKRVGATKTYSSNGWIDSSKKDYELRTEIAKAFCYDGDLLWVPIISLKDFMTSAELSLFNEEDYAAIFAKVLPQWFRKTGFENDNMIWWMDHHVNTDNPHVHLSFLEKDKTKKNGKLNMKDINNFKGLLWKELFSKKKYLEATGRTVEAGFKHKDLLKRDTYASFTKNLKLCDEKEFIASMKKLYERLPLSGRLQYNSSHMIPYREELDQLVDRLLHMPDTKEKYEAFMKSVKEFDTIKSASLNTNFSILTKQEDKKLRVYLANTILKELKEKDYEFWEARLNDTITTYLPKFHDSSISSDIQDMPPYENSVKNNSNSEKQSHTMNNKRVQGMIIPIAGSLIKNENDSTIFFRVPRTQNYIIIDKNQCLKISEQKNFYTANISPSQTFNVYNKMGDSLNFNYTFEEIERHFDNGQFYIDSIIEQEKKREIWQARRKEWINSKNNNNNRIWQESTKKIKRASFSWMFEVEQEVNQARNDFFNGKEFTLSW